MSVRTKTILLVSLIFVVFSFLTVYQGVRLYEKELDLIVLDGKRQLQAVVESTQKNSLEPYRKRIKSFAEVHSGILKAFAERDRDLTYTLSLPVFRTLKRENSYFFIMHFHLPDGTSFLRMHRPSLHDDDLSRVRPIVQEVHRSGKQLSGFEIGRFGAFYRVVQPLFYQGRYVGAVEFGIRVKMLVDALGKKISGDVASYFSSERWKKATLTKRNLTEPGPYTIIADENSPFTRLPGDVALDSKGREIIIGEKTYLLQAFPVIRDFRGASFGGIAVLEDISPILHRKRRFLLQFILGAALSWCVAIVVLYYAFNRLMGRLDAYRSRQDRLIGRLNNEVAEREKAEAELQKARDLLELKVAERSAELAASNASLTREIEEHKKARDALEQESSVNECLAGLSSALVTVTSIDEISAMVLEKARTFTKSALGFAGHIDPETGDLVSPAFTKEIWTQCGIEGKTAIFKKFNGLWGWVLTNKKSILSNRPADDPRSSGIPQGHVPVRRFLASPALYEGNLVGMIALANPEKDYSEKDLQLLERLATFYALAIQRMQSEHALMESEEKFRILMESANEFILVTQDGRIKYANPKFIEFGYPLEELMRRPFGDFLHPEDREMVVSRHMRRLKGELEPVDTYSFRAVTKDGQIRWLEVRSALTTWDNRPATFNFLTDITRQKETEKQLRKYEKNRELLFNGSREITTTTDLKELYRKIVTVSRKFLDLDFVTLMILSEDKSTLTIRDTIGFPSSMIDTFSLVKGQGLSTYAVEKKKPATVLDFGKDTRFEVPPVVFEKNITSAICVPMLLADEVFGVLIGHTHDKREFMEDEITLFASFANQAAVAIKNSEALIALKESEERYRDLFENSGDLIQMVRSDGRLAYVNRAWRETLGYTEEEIRDMSIFDIIHPDHHLECEKRFPRFISGKDISGRTESVFVAKDGRQVFVEGSCTRKTGPDDEVTIQGIFSDVTAKRKLEEETQKAEKLESIGILAGGIAHDFNNLLTAILGNISLAKMCAEPGDEIHEALEETERASLRARDLTQQLLTFSKGGAPVRKTMSLPELIRDSVSFALTGSNVRCEFSIAGDLWLADVDEGQLNQVLHNLAINADQAMPKGGILRVSAENREISEQDALPLEPGRFVMISVSDQGHGIPKEHISNIFDPYFSTKKKGSGLGLAVAYSIIKKHDGLITAESEEGAGATFRIYLPASMQQVPIIREAETAVHRGSGRILVMDDEKVVQMIASRMLEKLGYEVECAGDGSEAIALYRSAAENGNPFDVVILDLTIPGGMGGKETIEKLREIDPDIRAVVSSGYANDPIMSDFRHYGFCGVVPKPYSVKIMSETLREVCMGTST